MRSIKVIPTILMLLILTFTMSACDFSAIGSTLTPTVTHTPMSTWTATVIPSETPTPSSTPKPTRTPNFAATQKIEDFHAEAQRYFDLGYLSTTDGVFKRQPTYEYDWAQINWYRRNPIYNVEVSDFFITAHITWSSAYRNANTSGCGFSFAEQENGDHYAVFLDRSKVLFVKTDYYYHPIGPVRGSGLVKFDNPFDAPVEADLTLIVNGTQAFVLVDGEFVAEYALSQSGTLKGTLAYSILSGTNKDFGTRCNWSDIHIFVPN
ncbi:MAG: hypothetical protein RL226_624 [Bacteroidota bacterium]